MFLETPEWMNGKSSAAQTVESRDFSEGLGDKTKAAGVTERYGTQRSQTVWLYRGGGSDQRAQRKKGMGEKTNQKWNANFWSQ